MNTLMAQDYEALIPGSFAEPDVEKLARERLDRWAEDKGYLRPYNVKGDCFRRFLGGICADEREEACLGHLPPGCDHPSLWLSMTHNLMWYVFQPYHLNWENLKLLTARCYGIARVDIQPGLSWWYPGETVLVSIERHMMD